MEEAVNVEVTNISNTSYDEPNICPGITCLQVSWSVHVFKTGSNVKLCLFCLPNNHPPMLLRADWEIKVKPVSSAGPKKCWRCRVKLTHHNMKKRSCCAVFTFEDALSKTNRYYKDDSILLEIKICDPERDANKWKCKGEISPNKPGEDMNEWYKQMFRVTDEWQEDIRGRKSVAHTEGRTNRNASTGTGFKSYLNRDERSPFANESSLRPGRNRNQDQAHYRRSPIGSIEDRQQSMPPEQGLGHHLKPIIAELNQRSPTISDTHTFTREERNSREPQRERCRLAVTEGNDRDPHSRRGRERSASRQRDERRERSASRQRDERRDHYVSLPPSSSNHYSHDAVSQIVTKETSEEAIIRLSNLEECVEILKENIITMKTDLDVVKRKSSTATQYDMGVFSKVESDGKSLEGAVARSEEKLRCSNENIQRTRKDSQNLMENLNKLSSSVNRIDKQERMLEGDVGVLSQQVEHMSIKAIDLDTRVEAMESDVKEVKKQMTGANEEMRNISTSIGEITEFAKRLEASTQQTKNTISTIEQALIIMVGAVDKITVNVKKLKKYEREAKKNEEKQEATNVNVKEKITTQI